MAESRLLSGRRSRLWPKEPAFWPKKEPALARRAGLHRLSRLLWPKKSRLTPALLWPKKSRLTPAEPALLAEEAGFRRLTPASSFWPRKPAYAGSAGFLRPERSRVTPAQPASSGRSRLLPGQSRLPFWPEAGFLQGATCCTVLLQAALQGCVLLCKEGFSPPSSFKQQLVAASC